MGDIIIFFIMKIIFISFYLSHYLLLLFIIIFNFFIMKIIFISFYLSHYLLLLFIIIFII